MSYDFLKLEWRVMFRVEYGKYYNWLFKYAILVLQDEVIKCTRFKDSLSGEIGTHDTTSVEWTYFVELVDISK